MRKTKEASGVMLAIILVLAVVGLRWDPGPRR